MAIVIAPWKTIELWRDSNLHDHRDWLQYRIACIIEILKRLNNIENTHHRHPLVFNLPSMALNMPAAISWMHHLDIRYIHWLETWTITRTLPKAFEMTRPPYRMLERSASSCHGIGMSVLMDGKLIELLPFSCTSLKKVNNTVILNLPVDTTNRERRYIVPG